MGLFSELFDSVSGFNSYMPPKGYMVDHNAQALDKSKNYLSDYEVMINTRNGKYNVPIPDSFERNAKIAISRRGHIKAIRIKIGGFCMV